MKTLKCPNCNASIEMDDDQEIGFCKYCGQRVQVFIKQNLVHDHTDAGLRLFQKQKEKAQDITQYLKTAFILETNLYSMNNIICDLQKESELLCIPNEVKKPEKVKAPVIKRALIGAAIAFIPALIIAGVIFDVLLKGSNPDLYYSLLRSNNMTPMYTLIIVLCVVAGAMCSIYISNKTLSINSKNTIEYEKNVKMENKRMTEEHEKKKILNHKIEELKYRKAETMKLLNRVYSLGVVQKKYCNFIAIGTLYEYFANGRTVSLELTPNDKGAYNLYEEESRMEKVITRLDMVVTRLNSIRTMQSFIYNAITDSQRQLDSIQESINRLGEYNQRIINQNQDTNQYLNSLVNNSTFRTETY